MTDPSEAEGDNLADPFKGEKSDGTGIDLTEFITLEGYTSDFDDLLGRFEQDEDTNDSDEFGTLHESDIPSGRTGVVEPELNDKPIEPGEIAFGIVDGELRKITKLLALILRGQPNSHRRCRIVIDARGVTWHATVQNGFIDYATLGRPVGIGNEEIKTVIVALSDLQAAANAVRDTATFRIRGAKVHFSAKYFERPILTYAVKGYLDHTDSLRIGIDLDVPRPEISTFLLRDTLIFLSRIAPPAEDDSLDHLIQIKAGTARALQKHILGQVEASLFEGINIAFRPGFLRWLLPALKERASIQLWHSEKFCILRNGELTFGIELVPHELPAPPPFNFIDTLLTPSSSLRTFCERAVRMFGSGSRILIQSDERGAGSPLSLRADSSESMAGILEMPSSANRDGPHPGPIKVTVNAGSLLTALRMSSGDANAEILIESRGSAIFISKPRADANFSAVLFAKVERF